MMKQTKGGGGGEERRKRHKAEMRELQVRTRSKDLEAEAGETLGWLDTHEKQSYSEAGKHGTSDHTQQLHRVIKLH